MKQFIQAAAVSVAVSFAAVSAEAVVWDGPTLTFTKADFADPNDAANRDIIIPGVVEITRADTMGLFNHAVEAGYSTVFSPADTEWAFDGLISNAVGTVSLANFAALNYTNWQDSHGSLPSNTVGRSAVMHIISADIYIGLTFDSWTGGGNGGGFSYTRTTAPTVSAPATLSLLLAGAAGLAAVRRKG